jgi:GNAT superfamily N-acetyltransferase
MSLMASPDHRGDVSLRRLQGQAMEPFLPELARLRIRVFRDYPYLYDGDLDYESNYLQSYMRTPSAVLVLAEHEGAVVGAATGLPLVHETDNIVAPFRHAGLDPARLFYFGESVLLPDLRGRGIGVAFFEHREAHALEVGGFRHACFCGVARPSDHPARPAGYVPLDGFWRRRGYVPLPDVVARFSWKDVGEEYESEKPMAFWIKQIEQREPGQ